MILEDQKKQDNTVGSRSKIDLAYIAGFLLVMEALCFRSRKGKMAEINFDLWLRSVSIKIFAMRKTSIG